MKTILNFLSLVIFSTCFSATASDNLSPSIISKLSYRGGYILFELNNNGTNSCAPCPTDPSGFGSKKCWVSEDKKVQVSMILAAHAQGKKLEGRVNGLTTNCEIYQMTIID